MPEADRRFGTPMHGLERFGKDALSYFLSDLDSATHKGFKLDQCNRVKSALSRIRTEIDRLPEDSFLRRMWDGFKDFQFAYDAWNQKDSDASEEAIAHRRAARKQLKKAKDKLYAIFNEAQMHIQEELDYVFVDKLYAALEDLALSEPGLFPELSTAIARWRRFRPGSDRPHPRLLRRAN